MKLLKEINKAEKKRDLINQILKILEQWYKQETNCVLLDQIYNFWKKDLESKNIPQLQRDLKNKKYLQKLKGN